MVLSIGVDGDPEYYLRHQADYYTGGAEAKGLWYTPFGQFRLPDGSPISDRLFRSLCDGFSPDGVQIGRPPKNVALERVKLYDLVFSPAKSVSLLWALGDDDLRQSVAKIQEDAVRRALATAQNHAAFVRRGRNGMDVQPARLFGATFQHGDSRPIADVNANVVGDPNLHTHAVIFNLGQDDQGRWFALDGYQILQWKMALGATYHAELAMLLETRLGCRTSPRGRNGEFEVVGVERPLIERFSRRRQEIEKHLADRGLKSTDVPAYAAATARATREAKPSIEDSETEAQRFERWATEAAEFGVTADDIRSWVDRQVSDDERRLRDVAFQEAVEQLPLLITETEAVVAQRDIHRQIAAVCANYGRGADAVDRIYSALIRERQLVPLPDMSDEVGRPLYSTPDLIEKEQELRRIAAATRDDARHVLPYGLVERHIAELAARGSALTDEQAQGLRWLTTQRGLLSVLEGGAGTGKSHSMREVTHLYRDALNAIYGEGYRVLGTSAKWLTARALSEDAGLDDGDSRAAAQWIADVRAGRISIDERTVLIIDEAGQMGVRDLHSLVKSFTDAGAKIILTGDRKQQLSVGAGPGLDIIVSQTGSLRLEQTQRMRPQADDILVHIFGMSREESIFRTLGFSPEQRRSIVRGNALSVRDEIAARFRDKHYDVTAYDVFFFADGLSRDDAIASVRALKPKEAAKLARRRSDEARAGAAEWVRKNDIRITPADIFHYLYGQTWETAIKREAMLPDTASDALVNGRGRHVKPIVKAWAMDVHSTVDVVDVLHWVQRLPRKKAIEEALMLPPAEAERLVAENAIATRERALLWADSSSTRVTAEDVRHWVDGLPWQTAFSQMNGMTPSERDGLLKAHTDQVLAMVNAWPSPAAVQVRPADVLVQVFGLSRKSAEAAVLNMSLDDQQRLIEEHHNEVGALGQIWARKAATDFSYGRAQDALKAFSDHGRLIWSDTHVDSLERAVSDWKHFIAVNPAAHALVLAKSNESVAQINNLMRDHLRATGALGNDVVTLAVQGRRGPGELPIALGDQIVFRKRYKDLDIYNGTIGRISSIEPAPEKGHATLMVTLSDGRQVKIITANYADDKGSNLQLEHSYAMTTFSAQGATKVAVFALIDSTQRSNAAYVAASRAMAYTVLYSSRQTEDDILRASLSAADRFMSKFTDRDRIRSLAGNLARPQSKTSTLDAFVPSWRSEEKTYRAAGYYDDQELWWRANEDDIRAAALAGWERDHVPLFFDTSAVDIPDLPIVPVDSYADTFEPWHDDADAFVADVSPDLSLEPEFGFAGAPWDHLEEIAQSSISLEPSEPLFRRAVSSPIEDYAGIHRDASPPPSPFPLALRPHDTPRPAVLEARALDFTLSAPLPNRILSDVDPLRSIIVKWDRALQDHSISLVRAGVDSGEKKMAIASTASSFNVGQINRGPQYDRDQVQREMEAALSGDVDFRDILLDHGWQPVGSNRPNINCFWTKGSTKRLDSSQTISVKQLGSDAWVWTAKDGSVAGNIVTFLEQYEGFNARGRDYFDLWQHVRNYLKDAPPLLQHVSDDERARRAEAHAQRRSAREAKAAQAEAEYQADAEATWRRHAHTWEQFSTVPDTSTNNYLERRGISLSTQKIYSDNIRFHPTDGFVAFRHINEHGTLTGFEQKASGFNKFSFGAATKSLAIFGQLGKNTRQIVVTETGVDALSRAQLDGCPPDVVYISTGGQRSAEGEEHLLALASRYSGIEFVLATDRDQGGDGQARHWEDVLNNHPVQVRRERPTFTRDWNNELRLPDPALLTVDEYRKDCIKAVPPLPPPDGRPDLASHWQAAEGARPHMADVARTIAGAVGAMSSSGEVDYRAFRDAGGKRLYDAIVSSISGSCPLPSAIKIASETAFPGWHAYATSRKDLNKLRDTLARHLGAWQAHSGLDQRLFNDTAAPDAMERITDHIREGSAFPDAIRKALDAITAEQMTSAKHQATPQGLGKVLSVLQTVLDRTEQSPDYAIPPASPADYPVFSALYALSEDIQSNKSYVATPTTWESPIESWAVSDVLIHFPRISSNRPDGPSLPSASTLQEVPTSMETNTNTDRQNADQGPLWEATASAESAANDAPLGGDAFERRNTSGPDILVEDEENEESGIRLDPPTAGQDYGLDASSEEKQKHDGLRTLAHLYQTWLPAKYENDVDFIAPDPADDQVVIHLRDRTKIRHRGHDLFLSGQPTAQKAALMIDLLQAKGFDEQQGVFLRGPRDFRRLLAFECFKAGVPVRNVELQAYMKELESAYPDLKNSTMSDDRRDAQRVPVGQQAQTQERAGDHSQGRDAPLYDALDKPGAVSPVAAAAPEPVPVPVESDGGLFPKHTDTSAEESAPPPPPPTLSARESADRALLLVNQVQAGERDPALVVRAFKAISEACEMAAQPTESPILGGLLGDALQSVTQTARQELAALIIKDQGLLAAVGAAGLAADVQAAAISGAAEAPTSATAAFTLPDATSPLGRSMDGIALADRLLPGIAAAEHFQAQVRPALESHRMSLQRANDKAHGLEAQLALVSKEVYEDPEHAFRSMDARLNVAARPIADATEAPAPSEYGRLRAGAAMPGRISQLMLDLAGARLEVASLARIVSLDQSTVAPGGEYHAGMIAWSDIQNTSWPSAAAVPVVRPNSTVDFSVLRSTLREMAGAATVNEAVNNHTEGTPNLLTVEDWLRIARLPANQARPEFIATERVGYGGGAGPLSGKFGDRYTLFDRAGTPAAVIGADRHNGGEEAALRAIYSQVGALRISEIVHGHHRDSLIAGYDPTSTGSATALMESTQNWINDSAKLASLSIRHQTAKGQGDLDIPSALELFKDVGAFRATSGDGAGAIRSAGTQFLYTGLAADAAALQQALAVQLINNDLAMEAARRVGLDGAISQVGSEYSEAVADQDVEMEE